MSPIIGYARVSTVDQRTDTQAAQLKAAGCSPIRVEKVSGKSRDGRTELAAVLDFIRAGDTLVVVKLDRLGAPATCSTSYMSWRSEALT